jgi:hypothetical protein
MRLSCLQEAEGTALAISDVTDGISRGIEGAGATLSETFFDTTLRLGVTGLSRAGKTVFITALVANLLNRGRMQQLNAVAQGRIETVYLQPQPDVTLPRFDYETHLAALTGDNPRWPASTRAISELRLSFRVRPSGLFASGGGPGRCIWISSTIPANGFWTWPFWTKASTSGRRRRFPGWQNGPKPLISWHLPGPRMAHCGWTRSARADLPTASPPTLPRRVTQAAST